MTDLPPSQPSPASGGRSNARGTEQTHTPPPPPLAGEGWGGGAPTQTPRHLLHADERPPSQPFPASGGRSNTRGTEQTRTPPPPPLAGEGWGGGARCTGRATSPRDEKPSPIPAFPRKRGKEQGAKHRTKHVHRPLLRLRGRAGVGARQLKHHATFSTPMKILPPSQPSPASGGRSNARGTGQTRTPPPPPPAGEGWGGGTPTQTPRHLPHADERPPIPTFRRTRGKAQYIGTAHVAEMKSSARMSEPIDVSSNGKNESAAQMTGGKHA